MAMEMRKDIAKGCRARRRQDHQDFLGGVGGGGEGIGGENRQPDGLADRLVRSVGGLQRAPDQPGAERARWFVFGGAS